MTEERSWLRDEISARGGDRPPRRGIGRAERAGLVVLAVAGAVLAIPRLTDTLTNSTGDLRPSPAPTTTSNHASGPSSVVAPILERWGERGNLSRSGSFGARVREAVPSSGCSSPSLLYAGKLPDGSRLGLVGCREQGSGGADDGVMVWAVHEPRRPGATPRLVVTQQGRLTVREDLAVWAGRGADGHVYALLLGDPNPIRIDVSGRLTVTSSGNLKRHWQMAASRDGVVIADLGNQTAPIVVGRRHGSNLDSVVTPVAYPAPVHRRTSGSTRRIDNGNALSRASRIADAALDHVLPGAAVRGPLRTSRVSSDHFRSVLVRARIGRTQGLSLLVETAPGPRQWPGSVVDGFADLRPLRLTAKDRTPIVVIPLPDGRLRRVPAPDGHLASVTNARATPVLDGGVLTLRYDATRVTVVDWLP